LRVDRLRDHPLVAQLAGVAQDEFAIACFVAVELKAWFACKQRLENRLALDELKIGDVPAVEIQEVEGVID
jgi:hypothetical protein